MSEKSRERSNAQDIEALAERAERGEDIAAHFTNRYVARQRVNIDFPLDLLRLIAVECRRLGVTRQAWITMACEDWLRQVLSAQDSDEDRKGGQIYFFNSLLPSSLLTLSMQISVRPTTPFLGTL